MTPDTLACTVCGSTLRMCGHFRVILLAALLALGCAYQDRQCPAGEGAGLGRGLEHGPSLVIDTPELSRGRVLLVGNPRAADWFGGGHGLFNLFPIAGALLLHGDLRQLDTDLRQSAGSVPSVTGLILRRSPAFANAVIDLDGRRGVRQLASHQHGFKAKDSAAQFYGSCVHRHSPVCVASVSLADPCTISANQIVSTHETEKSGKIFHREPWLRNLLTEALRSGTTATDRVSLAVLCGGAACLVVTLALLVAVWRGR